MIFNKLIIYSFSYNKPNNHYLGKTKIKNSKKFNRQSIYSIIKLS